MQPSPIKAWKIYWERVLTPPGRWLAVLQIGLWSAQLLLPAREMELPALPHWWVVSPDVAREAAMLGAFLVQWCAWSELLYGLRLRFQPAETQAGKPWRRFALHIYSGFIFLFVLSALANLQPLLGIGAMFLLFMSGEAQEKKLAQETIPMALLGGMGRSYRLISHEPWLFLRSLLLPGVVLYAGGVLVVWMRLVGAPWFVKGGALALWLGFFLLAQLKVALRAEGELDVDVIMGRESAEASQTPDPARSMLKALLDQFNGLSNGLATVLGLAGGGWLLLKLGEGGLLSTHALSMAFGAMVGLLSGTVSALLSLLVKLGFITVVSAVIVLLLMLIIGFGRREPLRPVKQVADRVQQGMQRIAGGLSDLNLARGATLGLGTLLTALGTVAVQSYDRVQKDQARQSEVRLTLQQQKQKEEDNTRTQRQENDAQVKRIQERVLEIGKATNTKEDLLGQLHSELRDVLPKLKLLNGATDGESKGRLLRYLYESGLLELTAKTVDTKTVKTDCTKTAKTDGTKTAKTDDTETCRDALLTSQREKPTKEVKKELIKPCRLQLFLHSMDFSGASLEGAYLKNAFLPFLNLQNAKLKGANLSGATFRYANFENADLTNTQLEGTDLSSASLVGTQVTGASGKPSSLDGAIAFYAVSDPAPGQTQKVISWDLVKGESRAEKNKEKEKSLWTFCPLDSQSVITQIGDDKETAQGGSKCMNRRFDAQEDKTQPIEFRDRDWSGSTFRDSTLKGLTFKGIALAGADLSNATLENMRLEDVSFAGANLEGATIKKSELKKVDFTGANLKGFRIDRTPNSHRHRYQGSVIELDGNTSFTTQAAALLRQKVYDPRRFSEERMDDMAMFRQNVLAPLLMAPLPLRPQQLLYWMIATPQPAALSLTSKAP